MIRNADKSTIDAIVTAILNRLDEYKLQHPRAVIEAYRRNPGSVRIRIIDPDFKGKGVVEREDMVGKTGVKLTYSTLKKWNV